MTADREPTVPGPEKASWDGDPFASGPEKAR